MGGVSHLTLDVPQMLKLRKGTRVIGSACVGIPVVKSLSVADTSQAFPIRRCPVARFISRWRSEAQQPNKPSRGGMPEDLGYSDVPRRGTLPGYRARASHLVSQGFSFPSYM